MKRLLLLAAMQSAILVGAQTRSDGHLFYEDFATKNNFSVNWTVTDANNDSKTWEYIDETSSPDADGGTGLAKYLYERNNAADDYLTTREPVTLKTGTHCLSFYYRTSTTRNKESMEVLYGKSKDFSTMKVLTTLTDVSINEWEVSINDFNVEEAGDYYFSFHVISEKNRAGFWLDNIAIDEGGFQGTPDITLENLVLPASDCNLGTAPIGVTVKNIGTGAINGFSLYYEIDDANKITQDFTDKIAVGGSLDVTFTTPADFSGIDQAYNVKVVANCDNQTVTSNDTVKGRVVNLSPTKVPFESSFKKAIDVLNWNPVTANGWEWNSQSGCYKANTTSTLSSRCIYMEPGEYRIIFSYNAGDELLIGGLKYDYFYIAFGKSGSDMATWTKIKEFKENTQHTVTKKEVQFTVAEEGNYVICFTSTELAYLEIHDIAVSKIADHDVKVESITPKIQLPRIVPQYHINTAHQFTVSIVNNGKQVENDIKLEIKGNNEVLATTTIPTLAVGEVKEETMDVNLVNAVSNEDEAFSFMALASISKDDYPEDNALGIATMVSDSTYAWDNPSDFEFGVGGKTAGTAFGTAFTILKEDVLTSITLGFMPKPAQANDKLTLNVYKIDTSDSSMGQPLVSKSVVRGEGGEKITYELPELNVVPGKYMFEVKQEGSNNMGLVCDQTANGLIAVGKNGFLNELPGYGYPYVRPNFSKNASTGLQNGTAIETTLQLYPNPASEAITIKTVGKNIEKISIHSLVGQTVLTAIGNGTAEQNLDISTLSAGTYLVVINTENGKETVKLIVK